MSVYKDLYSQLDGQGLIDHEEKLPPPEMADRSCRRGKGYVVAVREIGDKAKPICYLTHLGEVGWGPNIITTSELADATICDTRDKAKRLAKEFGNMPYRIVAVVTQYDVRTV